MIFVENLFVKYGSFEVLKNISLSVRDGDFLGIVGPNGSGKSTLVKTLVGLLPPSSGKIVFHDPGAFSTGYLPQSAGNGFVNFPATVREIVASGLVSTRKFPKWLNKNDYIQVDNALELLQIEDLSCKRIGKLSGGQQQRVHLARALVSGPKLLVLDEPTVALDPSSRDRFYKTLAHLNANHGITIILVSHDTHTIGRYINTILVLDRRIIFSGTYREFKSSSSVTHYFGDRYFQTCEDPSVRIQNV